MLHSTRCAFQPPVDFINRVCIPRSSVVRVESCKERLRLQNKIKVETTLRKSEHTVSRRPSALTFREIRMTKRLNPQREDPPRARVSLNIFACSFLYVLSCMQKIESL